MPTLSKAFRVRKLQQSKDTDANIIKKDSEIKDELLQESILNIAD